MAAAQLDFFTQDREGERGPARGEKGQGPVSGGRLRDRREKGGPRPPAQPWPSVVLSAPVPLALAPAASAGVFGVACEDRGRAAHALGQRLRGRGRAQPALDLSQGHFRTQTLEALGQMRIPGFEM